jgi:hypothetical protein
MPDWADLPQAPDQPLGPNGVKPVLPTGRKIALPLHEFHEFVDGRIAVTRHMEGWMELFAQLGAFPPSRTEPSEAIDD